MTAAHFPRTVYALFEKKEVRGKRLENNRQLRESSVNNKIM